MRHSDKNLIGIKLNHRWVVLSAAFLSTLALLTSLPALAEGGWLTHGQGLGNNANAHSDINKDNIDQVALKSIYNIDTTTAGGKTRGENAVGSGIAVTNGGMAYVPTTDGRIHVLNISTTDGSNADGTAIPTIVDVYDLVDDPRYTGGSVSDGDDIVINRMHPTLSGKNIYAGNYNLFFALDAGGFSNDLMGVPMLTNGLAFQSQGAVLFSIDKDSGDLNWKTIVDDNPHSMITNSVTIHKGMVFASLDTEMSGSLGISPFSYTDPFLNAPGVDPFLGRGPLGVPLPTNRSGVMFRNAMVALDETTGEVLWKTYFMPEQNYRSHGDILSAGGIDLWNGASARGSGNYPIDKKRNLIFVGTGEAYNSPLEADACESARLAVPMANPFSDDCIDIDQDGIPIPGPIHNVASGVPFVTSSSHPLMDSVIALDTQTGEIRWAKRLQGFDVWNFACIGFVLGGIGDNFDQACPPYLRGANAGLNFFAKSLGVGEQPMLVRKVKMPGGGKRDLLIVTNKAANVWALDPDNGDEVWKADAAFGAGSLFEGGILWGSATDGERIYLTSTTSNLNIADVNDPAFGVVAGSCPAEAFDPGTGDLNGGIYGALDLATGEIAWQRCLTAAKVDAVTGEAILDENNEETQIAGFNEGPVSVGQGVVYVPGPTTGYAFFSSGATLRAQVIALDAETGELLRRFPFNAAGEPSATRTRYTRTAITANRIVIGNGLKDDFGSFLAQRVVVYELQE